MLNVKKKECEVYLLHIFVIQTFNNLHILFFLHLTFYSQRVANNVETNLSFWNEIKLVYVENNNKSFAKNYANGLLLERKYFFWDSTLVKMNIFSPLHMAFQMFVNGTKIFFLGFDTGKNEHIFPITHGISDIC